MYSVYNVHIADEYNTILHKCYGKTERERAKRRAKEMRSETEIETKKEIEKETEKKTEEEKETDTKTDMMASRMQNVGELTVKFNIFIHIHVVDWAF